MDPKILAIQKQFSASVPPRELRALSRICERVYAD
jgi:hypothetical protein